MLKGLIRFLIAFMSAVAVSVGVYTFLPAFSNRQVDDVRQVKHENKVISTFDSIQYVHKNIPADPNAKYGNLEDVLRRGELVVCALKRDYNQFFQMKVGNSYIGEDVKLASALGEALGVKVIYKMVYESNDDVVDAVYNGEGDIGLAKLSYTSKRARKVAFSVPYVSSRKMLLLNRMATADDENNTLDEVLNNKSARIAVMRGTSYENFAKSLFPKAQIQLELDWENGVIPKLERGEVIAAVRDELRIKTLINLRPQILLNFMPVIIEGEGDSISAIVANKEYSLISYVDKFLKNEYKVLNVKEILDTYREYIK